jgi:DNA-binding transcriptional ArsR family regulator
MDAVFAALADPTRRGMVARLAQGPVSIGELGRPYRITKPAVTKHVKVLERAGLVRRTREGRVHRCQLQPEPLQNAEAWIEQQRRFWQGTLDRLAAYLEHTTNQGVSE